MLQLSETSNVMPISSLLQKGTHAYCSTLYRLLFLTTGRKLRCEAKRRERPEMGLHMYIHGIDVQTNGEIGNIAGVRSSATLLTTSGACMHARERSLTYVTTLEKMMARYAKMHS